MENRFKNLEKTLEKIHEISRDNNKELVKTTTQLKQVNGNIAELKKKDQNHDEKFEKLNEFKNQIKGGLYLLGFILTIIGIKVFAL